MKKTGWRSRARQQYLYVLDGGDHRVWILLRDSLQVVGQFGRHGH